jgi:uncharacterized cupin superfamily protein
VSDQKSPSLPALDPGSVAPNATEIGINTYPEPLGSLMGQVERRALGDACELNKLGVNMVVLQPGAQSALRHWHTLEDEFVYVIEGDLSLITDFGEQILSAGMSAGFPAARRDAHHLVNRSDRPARVLEIGSRIDGDDCFYPDNDFMWITTEDGWIGAHKDGRPYSK